MTFHTHSVHMKFHASGRFPAHRIMGASTIKLMCPLVKFLAHFMHQTNVCIYANKYEIIIANYHFYKYCLKVFNIQQKQTNGQKVENMNKRVNKQTKGQYMDYSAHTKV